MQNRWFMTLGCLLVFALPCWSAQGSSSVSPQAVELAAPPHGAETATDPHAQATAAIRHHKLQHLNERMNTPPDQLRTQCRYESEVATPPPFRKVALTFDDGPDPVATPAIVATLKKHGVRAAFFMIGRKVSQHPELVDQVRAAGHLVIASHSWDHPNFHSISAQAQADEVMLAENALGNLMQPRLFRYPYGNASCETNDLLHSRGYRIVGWHIDSCDWAFDRTGTVDTTEGLSCGVLAQFRSDYLGHILASVRAHNGGIILMHEIHHNTVAALDAIITGILAEGMTFGSVDDLEFADSLR